MTAKRRPLLFFLGGRDLEMATIASLVAETLGASALLDKGLGWGAKASELTAEIAAARRAGQRPVLIELRLDIDVGDAIVIDHHGARAEGPTALEQVFALLELPAERWTRQLDLIAANDRGHLRAMATVGASHEEMAEIRKADRAAQGITPSEEATGLAALATAETLAKGRLLVVRCPHDRTATVVDPLRLEEMRTGAPERDLLIEAPAELAFYGRGAAVSGLDAAFPGGWTGGDLPSRGFWGIERTNGRPTWEAAAAVVEATLDDDS